MVDPRVSTGPQEIPPWCQGCENIQDGLPLAGPLKHVLFISCFDLFRSNLRSLSFLHGTPSLHLTVPLLSAGFTFARIPVKSGQEKRVREELNLTVTRGFLSLLGSKGIPGLSAAKELGTFLKCNDREANQVRAPGFPSWSNHQPII